MALKGAFKVHDHLLNVRAPRLVTYIYNPNNSIRIQRVKYTSTHIHWTSFQTLH